MWGNWFIVTLVTHRARGWAEVSTTSASIRWIRPGYMYSDESSRVLVYWLKGHNMLGWYMYVGLWRYIWLHDKNLVGSSLPFACLIALYVVLLSLRWSSIYWWEQMREVLAVNRGGMIPLHSLHGLDFNFLLGFSLGLWPMYLSVFWFIYIMLNFLACFLSGIMVCLGL